ncbi:MAG: hypothetical protein U9R04_02705 [Chloroflexota bacterium]|nr:hypothetical protein [Chloroflexota bacterium]
MAKEVLSTAESLAKTRTYGKFRCPNPECMARITVPPGTKTCKCPQCGLEWRVSWVAPDFPRVRGPVWDVNRKLVQEMVAKKKEGK